MALHLLPNKTNKQRPLWEEIISCIFLENNAQLIKWNHIDYLQILFWLLPICLNFDKNFENGHHVWGSVINRKFNTNITFLVEIESKRTDLDSV